MGTGGPNESERRRVPARIATGWEKRGRTDHRYHRKTGSKHEEFAGGHTRELFHHVSEFRIGGYMRFYSGKEKNVCGGGPYGLWKGKIEVQLT